MLMSETLAHPDEGAAFISEQDAALRRWTHDTPWPIKIGSDEHRKMFRRMVLDTHDPSTAPPCSTGQSSSPTHSHASHCAS